MPATGTPRSKSGTRTVCSSAVTDSEVTSAGLAHAFLGWVILSGCMSSLYRVPAFRWPKCRNPGYSSATSSSGIASDPDDLSCIDADAPALKNSHIATKNHQVCWQSFSPGDFLPSFVFVGWIRPSSAFSGCTVTHGRAPRQQWQPQKTIYFTYQHEADSTILSLVVSLRHRPMWGQLACRPVRYPAPMPNT